MTSPPEPVPGEGQVVVAVDAFSINRGETFLLQSPRPNWRPGQDVAGRVVQTVPGGPAEGTRVVAIADQAGWAERVALDLDQIAALPEQLPATTAAALPLAGLTASRLLRQAGSVIGERLL